MKPRMLCTGAAGFIGNAACAHYQDRFDIIGIDDYSRPGSSSPLGNVLCLDTDAERIPNIYPIGFDVVLHLAAQVSVVASLVDPEDDFKRNAALTMKLAHWAANTGVKAFIYASTNKVYGELRGRTVPIPDCAPLNPETPYGISKACGGLYVREFLPDTGFVFNQSCICGESQSVHATEDQGWIGYLIKRIREGQTVTCCGDGMQVRDLLHVSDLLKAYDLAIRGDLEPGAYGVGGGPENAVNFAEAVELLGGKIADFKPPRPRDQRYFVAASDGLRAAGWNPETNAREWLRQQAPVSA